MEDNELKDLQDMEASWRQYSESRIPPSGNFDFLAGARKQAGLCADRLREFLENVKAAKS